MATVTVPQGSDGRSLSSRLLHRKPVKRTVYVLEERCAVHGVTLMDTEYEDRDKALWHMEELIRWTPGTFRPGGPVRIVVTAVIR